MQKTLQKWSVSSSWRIKFWPTYTCRKTCYSGGTTDTLGNLAALLGTGTPPEPKGVVNFAALTANSFAGGNLQGYNTLLLARRALRGVNSDVTAFIMNPREEAKMVETLDGEGQFLTEPPVLAKVPMLTTTKIPTNGGVGTNESKIFAGDWSKILVGVRTDIRIEVLKERFADYNQFAFIAFMRADVTAEHDAAFTVLSGITPG